MNNWKCSQGHRDSFSKGKNEMGEWMHCNVCNTTGLIKNKNWKVKAAAEAIKKTSTKDDE